MFLVFPLFLLFSLEDHGPVERQVPVLAKRDLVLQGALEEEQEEDQRRDGEFGEARSAVALGAHGQAVAQIFVIGGAFAHAKLKKGGWRPVLVDAEHVAFLRLVGEDAQCKWPTHDQALGGHDGVGAVPDRGGRVANLEVGHEGPVLDMEEALRGMDVEHALAQGEGGEREGVEKLDDCWQHW